MERLERFVRGLMPFFASRALILLCRSAFRRFSSPIFSSVVRRWNATASSLAAMSASVLLYSFNASLSFSEATCSLSLSSSSHCEEYAGDCAVF